DRLPARLRRQRARLGYLGGPVARSPAKAPRPPVRAREHARAAACRRLLGRGDCLLRHCAPLARRASAGAGGDAPGPAARGRLLLAFPLGDGSIHVDDFLGRPVSLDFVFFTPQAVADELVRAGFTALEVIERDPYPGVEYPSRRAYLFAR